MTVNKVILVARLGDAPKVNVTPNGFTISECSVATTKRQKDKHTQQYDNVTTWHNVKFLGKTAEIAAQYLQKGTQVYIEGELATDKWQDKDGNNRYKTYVLANQMQMLGSKQDSSSQNQQSEPQAQQYAAPMQQPVQQPQGFVQGRQGHGQAGNPNQQFDDRIPF